MSACKGCGREGGHFIGCPKTPSGRPEEGATSEDVTASEMPAYAACSFDGCPELRRSTDKRVKFCEFHSDPKNRK